MCNNVSYIWYVGYGSNLDQQRFYCYIQGGRPKYGHVKDPGCSNRILPLRSQSIRIPYKLYFAPINKRAYSNNWGAGGVAFLEPEATTNPNDWTLGRMWRITRDQYEEIRDKEGRKSYDKEIPLGAKDNISICTITNSRRLENSVGPSENYIKTIVSGLLETYQMPNPEIVNYLINKAGINGNYTEEQLLGIIGEL